MMKVVPTSRTMSCGLCVKHFDMCSSLEWDLVDDCSTIDVFLVGEESNPVCLAVIEASWVGWITVSESYEVVESEFFEVGDCSSAVACVAVQTEAAFADCSFKDLDHLVSLSGSRYRRFLMASM